MAIHYIFKIIRFYGIAGIFQGFCGISSQILLFILICVDSVDFVFSKCLCSMDCFGRFAPSQRRQWRGLLRQPLQSLAKTIKVAWIASSAFTDFLAKGRRKWNRLSIYCEILRNLAWNLRLSSLREALASWQSINKY